MPQSNLSTTQQLVATLYRNELGNPIILSPAQDAIFKSISMKLYHRMHIMCHTRFGKSLTTGLAVLTRTTYFPEKWAIVAGTKEKSKIIMDYVIQHIFDNDISAKRFVPDKGDNLDDIRRYRNKNHVTFRVGTSEENKPLYGEVFVGSAKDALGFGAPNVVEDESAIIPNKEHELVMRMLGDNPYDNYLYKIGNPFNRFHFYDSYRDPAYKKIIVNCYRSLQEGRITQALIDENRHNLSFKVLYECLFPSATEIDESGWMYLITDIDLDIAIARQVQEAGKRRLGHDVARGGGNYNVWTLRTDNKARVLDKDECDDLTQTGDKTINLMRDNGIDPRDTFIDDSGVGGGETDYLKSRGCKVNPVNFGETAQANDTYANVRAECYADGVYSWIKQFGSLVDNKGWMELTNIRYKKDHTGRIKLESKDDMRKRGVMSPDVADSLALTFAKPVKNVYYKKVDPAVILAGGRTYL